MKIHNNKWHLKWRDVVHQTAKFLLVGFWACFVVIQDVAVYAQGGEAESLMRAMYENVNLVRSYEVTGRKRVIVTPPEDIKDAFDPFEELMEVRMLMDLDKKRSFFVRHVYVEGPQQATKAAQETWVCENYQDGTRTSLELGGAFPQISKTDFDDFCRKANTPYLQDATPSFTFGAFQSITERQHAIETVDWSLFQSRTLPGNARVVIRDNSKDLKQNAGAVQRMYFNPLSSMMERMDVDIPTLPPVRFSYVHKDFDGIYLVTSGEILEFQPTQSKNGQILRGIVQGSFELKWDHVNDHDIEFPTVESLGKDKKNGLSGLNSKWSS